MAYISFQPSDYFNTLLWTGNSGNQSITGNDFTADLTWSKTRSHAESHVLMDTVRDAGTTLNQSISSNTANVEGTLNNSSTLTVNSTGFDLAGTSGGTLNYTGYTYATWLWRAGGHTGSANTDGSISSTVSANTTAGFSIVKYTGNLTSGANIGHGLGVKPAMIIIKNLDAAESWLCYHTSLGATKHIKLNATEAAGTATSRFNDTEPTTSLFTVGNDPQTNGNSNDMIAYCFAEKKGFSKFGSYVGNNNTDGIFLYLGFQARFIMIKNISTSTNGDWIIYDTARDIDNPISSALEANQSQAEVTGTGRGLPLDITSTGIKMRHSYGESNASSTYIYMAFAEFPIVSSNDIPATAR
jgi:hypothetical protein